MLGDFAWGLGFWVWLNVLGLAFRDFVYGFGFRVLDLVLGDFA